MLTEEIVKMEISQHYHFNNHFHHDTFIIDFDDGNAYWDLKYFFETMEWKWDREKYGLQESDPKNHELYKVLDSRVTHDSYNLNEAEKFLEELEKIDIFDQIDSSESSCLLLNHVKFLNEIQITLYSDNSEEKYVVNWNFPKSWLDFAKLLENLVGFDVLNVQNSKYFVSKFDYDFQDDWIVDNKQFNELTLDKIRFNYNNRVVGSCISDWIIDLSEKTLMINTYLHNDAHWDLSDELLNNLDNLLRKYHVFSWSSKESWSNLPEDSWVMCGGYNWCLEFEFTNGAIYNVGGYNVHPGEYFDFANEIIGLFGIDLLRSVDCNDWNILKDSSLHHTSEHDLYVVFKNNERIGFCHGKEIERYNELSLNSRILFHKVSADNLLEELNFAKENGQILKCQNSYG